MQFSEPPRNISNLCSALLCADEWWFSTTMVHAFHALLLPSKHYQIMYRVPNLFHDRRAGIHNFTLTWN